jgi:hypothetical protein
MDSTHAQKEFGWQEALPKGAVSVSGRVWFQDLHGMRSVFVDQSPFYHFSVKDDVENRFAAVQLVDAELASVDQVCRAFSLKPRTFCRARRQLHRGGIEGLVKEKRGPKGRREKTQQLARTIVHLYGQGQSVYQIASRVGVCPRTVSRVLRDEGIARRGDRSVSQTLPFADLSPVHGVPEVCVERPTDADAVGTWRFTDEAVPSCPTEPPVEVSQVILPEGAGPQPVPAEVESAKQEPREAESLPAAEESLTTSAAATVEPPETAIPLVATAPDREACGASEDGSSVVATSIPYAEPLDRFFTVAGLIEEAPVSFTSAQAVPQAGALLGLALVEETHLFEEARTVYGRLKNSWYGLRSLLWTLIVMGLLRIKNPEQIKSADPASLGRVLGLPRSAEVKTIRRKLVEIARRGLAAEFHRGLAKRRAEKYAEEVATLYVDGHVRAYHGKHRIGKTYLTRNKSVMRGETDYWVHLRNGQPLLVVHDAANGAFAEVLRTQVLPEIRRAVGSRRLTVVFDRAGWSKELLRALLEAGFDFITYRKGPYEPLDEGRFHPVTIVRDGQRVTYELAEDVFQEKGWPPLRLIAVKKKDGGQVHIVATGRATWELLGKAVEGKDLPAAEVAWWMFHRWCQENWFKYMDQEYALDLLVEYGTEPDDPQREVINATWRRVERQLRAARATLNREEAKCAQRVIEDRKARRKKPADCQGCGSCARCRLRQQKELVAQARAKVESLLKTREETPRKIRLGEAKDRDPVKLTYERKLFTDTVKVCAYEIETRLFEMALGTFRRGPVEGRALIRDILQTSGDLRVEGELMEVHLDQLSTPRATRAMMAICERVNALSPRLPETNLRLRFFVKPRPVGG